MVAMADMAIFSTHSFPSYWDSAVASSKPRYLVVDANWADRDLLTFLQAGKRHGATTVFEPVSAAKSARLFPPFLNSSVSTTTTTTTTSFPKSKKGGPLLPGLGLFPHSTLDLATPNQYELAAMYSAAFSNEYFTTTGPASFSGSSSSSGTSNPQGSWFETIDALGIHGGARQRFVQLTSPSLTDAGIPVQSVQLLPYIPTILTKLGPDGVLLTQLLHKSDPRLADPNEAPYILSRNDTDHPHVGGVYMRLFPPVEQVPTDEIKSVNGVGDTFLGVLVAGLNMGGKMENLVDVAQRAAVLTLKSRESVSLELDCLRGDLRDAAAAAAAV